MVEKRTTTASWSSRHTAVGHLIRCVSAAAKGRAASITMGAPWKPALSSATCEVTW